MTLEMMVALGENEVKSVEDFAGSVTEDLIGWHEKVDDESSFLCSYDFPHGVSVSIRVLASHLRSAILRCSSALCGRNSESRIYSRGVCVAREKAPGKSRDTSVCLRAGRAAPSAFPSSAASGGLLCGRRWLGPRPASTSGNIVPVAQDSAVRRPDRRCHGKECCAAVPERSVTNRTSPFRTARSPSSYRRCR